MEEPCLICDRIASIKEGQNPYFVKELKTGYAVIGDHQFYPGYSLFLCKIHATELHELDPDFKVEFLKEMSLVAEAVSRCFGPDKMNYELLGNKDVHLHWHLFPRYRTDPGFQRPVWVVDKSVRMSESSKPDAIKLKELTEKLKKELNRLT